MKGEITSCDRVVIEGMVDATMRDVHTVELASTGALKGTAEVEDAEISGTFEGDLTVRGKLTIHTSGRVRGNVTYGEIEIQRGGQISGNVRNAADAKTASMPNKAKAA
jgi:cytoskeletal protein CcmA (bactofilin family)